MGRLPDKLRADLAPEHQDLLKRDIALYRQLAHSPNALRAFQGLGYYIRHNSRLDPRLRELAILQVGWLARSPYEWSHHIKISYDFGVKDGDIAGLIADTAGEASALEPQAKLVLRAAREITLDQKATDATFAALGGFLDREQLVDLVLTISFYSAVVRVLATFEIMVEPDYMPYLEKYPLPEDK